jgi:hypothetical protein
MIFQVDLLDLIWPGMALYLARTFADVFAHVYARALR